jgi:hypothetical protein
MFISVIAASSSRLCGASLTGNTRRLAGVNVVEDLAHVRRWIRLGLDDGRLHLGRQLGVKRGFGVLVEEASGHHVALHTQERIKLPALGLDGLVNVACRIVGGVVRAEPIGARLDQCGTGPLTRPRDRPRAGLVDREEVIAVTSSPGNPYPAARDAKVEAAVWLLTGVEIAQPLFCSTKTTGARRTPARFIASWMSPSEDVPSPKYVMTTASEPWCARPQARPTACGTCVPSDIWIGIRFTRSGIALPAGLPRK